MASLDDLIDRLNKMSQDMGAMKELGDKIGSMMVEESKDSLFAPKYGTTINRRLGTIRSEEGEPPAWDKGDFFRNTTNFTQVNKSGPTIVTLHNNTEYAHRVEVGYDRPFLSWGRDRVLEDRGRIESAINEVFNNFFRRGLG